MSIEIVNESGGPIAPDIWKAKVVQMNPDMVSSLYTTYIKVTDLAATTPTRLNFTAADPATASDSDFVTMMPRVNPYGGNPISTNTDQKWGKQSEWLTKLAKVSMYSLTSSMSTWTLEAVRQAQITEWSELQTRQAANKTAIEALSAVDGVITTGPFTFTGTMPLAVAGTNDENPWIGADQTFGAGGMPAAPADSGGTTTTVGYVLTGEGTVVTSETGTNLSVKKTFTKRWKVEKVQGFTRVKHVKTRDFASSTSTFYTWIPIWQEGNGTWHSITSSVVVTSNSSNFTAKWLESAQGLVGLTRSDHQSYSCTVDSVWYDDLSFWVVANMSFVDKVTNGVTYTTMGVNREQTDSTPEILGQYHTETVGATHKQNVMLKDYSIWLVSPQSFGVRRWQHTINWNDPVPTVSCTFPLTFDIAIVDPTINFFDLVCDRLNEIGNISMNWPDGSSEVYTAPWGWGTGPWATSITCSVMQGTGNNQQTYSINNYPLPGMTTESMIEPERAAVYAVSLGSYITRTGTRCKYVFTEETGSYGTAELIAQKGQ